MKTFVNYTTINAIQNTHHDWYPMYPSTGGLPIPRVLGDYSNIGGIDQYNIYYTTDEGQEGFWQNYGPAGGTFNPTADGVNIITDGTAYPDTNYFIRQSPKFDGIVDVRWFGAIGSLQINDASIVSGSQIVTSSTATFSATDVGKNFILIGADNPANKGGNLTGMVIGFTAGSLTLSVPANVGVTEALLELWGHDDTDAIQSALDYISETNQLETNYGGGTVTIPKGIHTITDTLFIAQNCRLIGVNNRYHFVFGARDQERRTSGGSVIQCNFSDPNKWMISSATLGNSGSLIPPFNQDLVKAGGLTNSFNLYIYQFGINIENLTIDGNDIAFGGIRLQNSGNSAIRNVGMHNAKCGFMFNTCWGGTIDNCFVNMVWYGVLITECNSFVMNNCAIRFSEDSALSEPFPNEDYLPLFIKQPNWRTWGLSDRAQLNKTGIYAYNNHNLSISGSSIEDITQGNGITCLNSDVVISSCYLEDLYYGIILGMGIDTTSQAIIEQLFINTTDYAFFFGINTLAKINSVNQNASGTSRHNLFVPDASSGRNITFTNTIFVRRTYMKDILFVDEGVNGQNIGAIYIDTDGGDDNNYGFSASDPLFSFDAALVRVQNQSTINPVKIIYIKAASQVSETVTADMGAALKDTSVLSIENANILVTTYGEDYSVMPPKEKGRIFFQQYPLILDAKIGLIEMLGNVNLYFKNVDLYTYYAPYVESSIHNLTMFALKGSFGKLTFNNEPGLTSAPDIDLADAFHLIKCSNPSNLSLIEVKFINVNIYGGYLSPILSGTPSLGVDCIQINSTRTGGGWQDAIIIQNNF